jgi:hypothetical protein
MLLLVSGSTRDVRAHRASPCLGTLLRPGNGNCTACVLRSRAFDEAGLEDRTTVAGQHGGDVTRDRRLRDG